MISPSIIYNLNDTVSWVVTIENGPTVNTGVNFTTVVPTEFTFVSASATKGSYAGGTYTIGGMTKGEKVVVTLVYKLSTKPTVDKDFTFVAEVFGPDTIQTNNTLEDKVRYKYVSVPTLSTPFESQCNCFDLKDYLSGNCPAGFTEQIVYKNLVNGALTSNNGSQASVSHIDPIQPVTGTFDVVCTNGVTTNIVTADVPLTIFKQFDGPVGNDSWGTQTASTDITINGDGTAASPLSVASPFDPALLELIQDGTNVILNYNGAPSGSVDICGIDCTITNITVMNRVLGNTTTSVTQNIDYTASVTSSVDCAPIVYAVSNQVNSTVVFNSLTSIDVTVTADGAFSFDVTGTCADGTTTNLGTISGTGITAPTIVVNNPTPLAGITGTLQVVDMVADTVAMLPVHQ